MKTKGTEALLPLAGNKKKLLRGFAASRLRGFAASRLRGFAGFAGFAEEKNLL